VREQFDQVDVERLRRRRSSRSLLEPIVAATG
jgi:hypothetical protein